MDRCTTAEIYHSSLLSSAEGSTDLSSAEGSTDLSSAEGATDLSSAKGSIDLSLVLELSLSYIKIHADICS